MGVNPKPKLVFPLDGFLDQVAKTLGSSMGPRRVIEGQAAEVKRRERWVAAVKRRESRRRNVGLLAAS